MVLEETWKDKTVMTRSVHLRKSKQSWRVFPTRRGVKSDLSPALYYDSTSPLLDASCLPYYLISYIGLR
jgi:hypothetical protein